MKTSLFISTSLVLFCLDSFAKDIPYILEVQKNTPLFLRPSLSSERIAEAEQGTYLLFVEKSKKGFWVKLRDGDGVAGWMPLDRTDYKEVETAKKTIDEINKISQLEETRLQEEATPPSKEEQMREILAAQTDRRPTTFRLAPLFRHLSTSEPGRNRIGLRGDYIIGRMPLRGTGRSSDASLALEGSFALSKGSSASDDFSFAGRYSWRSPLWGPFLYGPDLGYSVDKVKDDFRHHFSFGLSSGVSLGAVDLSVRGGYDFFANSRASLELQLGVSF